MEALVPQIQHLQHIQDSFIIIIMKLHTSVFVVGSEPLDCLSYTFGEWRELEVFHTGEGEELIGACEFPSLTFVSGSVDCVGDDTGDGCLLAYDLGELVDTVLIGRGNDEVARSSLILEKQLHDDGGKVVYIHELALGLTRAVDVKRLLALACVDMMSLHDEGGDDVSVLEVEVIVGAIHIGGTDAIELGRYPRLHIQPGKDLGNPLGIRIAIIAIMRLSPMQVLLRKRVTHTVRENTCRQTHDTLAHASIYTCLDYIAIDSGVFSIHSEVVINVHKETAYLCCEVDDDIGSC